MTDLLKCKRCWSDRGFLITTQDGKTLEIKGQLPVVRILKTVTVSCLYCATKWQQVGAEATSDPQWITIGSYTVPEGEMVSIAELLRRMNLKINATIDLRSNCTRCSRPFDACPCPVFAVYDNQAQAAAHAAVLAVAEVAEREGLDAHFYLHDAKTDHGGSGGALVWFDQDPEQARRVGQQMIRYVTGKTTPAGDIFRDLAAYADQHPELRASQIIANTRTPPNPELYSAPDSQFRAAFEAMRRNIP